MECRKYSKQSIIVFSTFLYIFNIQINTLLILYSLLMKINLFYDKKSVLFLL